jgi:hypothetical protein
MQESVFGGDFAAACDSGSAMGDDLRSLLAARRALPAPSRRPSWHHLGMIMHMALGKRKL